jgi:hypothetical protein
VEGEVLLAVALLLVDWVGALLEERCHGLEGDVNDILQQTKNYD